VDIRLAQNEDPRPMTQINAVLVDPKAEGHVALGRVDLPVPRANEALVRVRATSLNRGEIRRASMGVAGQRIGWDFAGVVEKAAENGAGPHEGARVVGMLGAGAWAELIAAPTESLAVLPDAVDFTRAATLPVAGLTALYGLDLARGLIARRVLVTGGTGGVGHFAIQLAKVGGAHVTATVRRPEQAKVVEEAGADVVVVGDGAIDGPFDFVLDGVGGAVLARALAKLGKAGAAVVYGTTGTERLDFDLRGFYPLGGATIYGFILFHEMGSQPAGLGLARLASLVAEGRLRAPVEVEGKLQYIGPLAKKLMDRSYTGKAVVHFGT
jgi:NADPH:quinone reductase-like Zn-dependent oxidoreductase